MKKFLFLFVLIIIFSTANAFAETSYEKLYNEAEVPQMKFMHNIDPYQSEDYYNYVWAPYPLFRTATQLFFKDVIIPEGYYILAARTIKNKDYVFFKENGKVSFVVPVLETSNIMPDFYKRKIPKENFNKWQKFKHIVGYIINRQERKQNSIKAYIETTSLDNDFLRVNLYYGQKKYVMYFKTSNF